MGSASAKFCDFIFKHPGIFINLKGLMIMIMIMMIMNVGIKQLQKTILKAHIIRTSSEHQSATKESLKLNILVKHMGFHFRVTNVISNVL